jgi:4'-phosphopantetheinyl transferase
MQKTSLPSIWSLPPVDLNVQSDQVDVWRIRCDFPRDMLDRLEAALSSDERQRAAKFHFPADRDRFIAAHGCLRDVLGRYLHCEPHLLDFSIDSYGKPALREHKMEFNLSHSGDFVLVAVTRERKVGVDVERIRQGISSHVIAQQYFSKSEVAELEALPLEQRMSAFFTCWTRKEAYIKAQGLGLTLPLESFDVSLAPNKPAMLHATRPDAGEASRWTLFSLEFDVHYAGAVAVYGQGLHLRLWNWNPAVVH